MNRKIDKETRFYIDLDLKSGKILDWDYDQRYRLAQIPENPAHHRVFITEGQYNKLEQRSKELENLDRRLK